MDGQARGVFVGRISWRKDAQKTDAQQTNKNLLLSREALVRQRAPARDPGRRREVQARLHHRPARSRGPLLPALARHRRGRPPAACSPTRSPATSCARIKVEALRKGLGRATCASGCPARPTSRRRWYEHRGRASHARWPASRWTWPRRARATSPSSASTVHGRPLVYLDNAASSQKPQAVIDAERAVYEELLRQHPPRRALSSRCSPPTPTRRRGPRSSASSARPRRRRSIFTRGTTEGINLVAQTYGRAARRARATRC